MKEEVFIKCVARRPLTVGKRYGCNECKGSNPSVSLNYLLTIVDFFHSNKKHYKLCITEM